MKRTRLNIFIEPSDARRLDQLAVLKRVSKSSLIASALGAFLNPETVERRDTAILHRLDKLSAQYATLDHDLMILTEAFALFLLHHFSISPPVPEAQQAAARAQGRLRFEQFIQQLEKQIQRGKRFVKDVGA